MRRALAIVAVWLAAGTGAVMLSSAAVSMVGNRVTAGRPATLSADQVREQLRGAGSTTLAGPGGAPQRPSPDGVTTTRPARDDTTSSTAPTATTPTTAAKPSGGIVGQTTTTAASQQATVRTYALVGGTATLRFSPGGVTVQDATPRPGYSVEIEAEQGNGVKVEFRSDAHRSQVVGWWEDGPRDDVREDDESDD